MKTELAIEVLKELWRYEHTDKYTEVETREALDMAITALSADGDLISRQAVLDLAKDLTFEGGCKHRCVDVIKIYELPSVEKTASEKLDDIIARYTVQNILDLLTRHTALLNDIKMMMQKESEE